MSTVVYFCPSEDFKYFVSHLCVFENQALYTIAIAAFTILCIGLNVLLLKKAM